MIQGLILPAPGVFTSLNGRAYTAYSTVDLNSTSFLITGALNPTSTAVDAPESSLYLRYTGSGGFLYIKNDNGSSTNWTAVSTGSSNAFTDFQGVSGTTISPEIPGDTLTFSNSDSKIGIATDGTTDTIDFYLRNFTSGYVPFGSSGSLALSSDFYWDNTNKMLSLGYGSSPAARLHSLGQQVSTSPPTSFSGTYTAEVSNTLGTASASVTYGPEVSDNISSFSASQNDIGGSYYADGSTSINYTIYAVRYLNGIYYYRGTGIDASFNDNNNSVNFQVDLSWSPVASCDGYLISANGSANSGNPNFSIFISDASTSSWSDDGSNSASDSLDFWDSYAYAYDAGGTAPSALSGTITPTRTDVWSGSFFSTGQYYIYEVDSAVSIGGIWYTSGSPLASTSTYDENDFSGYNWNCSSWTYGGSETDLIVRRSTDGGSSWTYFFQPLSTDFTDANSPNDTTAEDAWGRTYSGAPSSFTHYYKQYGYRTSPTNGTLFYSTSFNSYSVEASNSENGYIITHTLTHGSGSYSKILGTHNPPFNTYEASLMTGATTVYELSSGIFTGATTVSPTRYGIQATGQTKYFRLHAQKTSPITYYSSSYLSGSVTLPNDGNYYTVTCSFTKGTGSTNTRVLRSDNGTTFSEGYLISGSSFVMEATVPTFADGTTVMPNSVDGPGAIFENTTNLSTGSMQITAKTQTASTGIAGIQFHSSTDTRLGAVYANTSDGILNLFANGTGTKFHNNSAGNYADILLTSCLFNKTYNSSFEFKVYSSSSSIGFRLIPSSGLMRGIIGGISSDYGGLFQLNNLDNRINLYMRAVSSQTASFLETYNSSGSLMMGISSSGDIISNTNSGIKIGTSSSQKLGFWNTTPIVRPTTSITGASMTSVSGSNVKENDTWDGYTIGKVIKALRNMGILA